MKKKWTYKIIMGMFIFLFGIFISKISLEAKTTVIKENKTYKINLDGKEKKETLKLATKVSKKSAGTNFFGDKIYTYTVNGTLSVNNKKIKKKVVLENYSETSFKGASSAMEVAVTDIDKKDGSMDIFFLGGKGSWCGTYYFIMHYQYKNGKLTKAEDMLPILEKVNKTTPFYSMVDAGLYEVNSLERIGTISELFKTTGNGKLLWRSCLFGVGYMHGYTTLKIKNGKLSLDGKKPYGTIDEVGKSYYQDAKNAVTILENYPGKCPVYQKKTGKKVAFYLKKGEKAEIEEFCYVGKKIVLKIKNQKGKKGFIKREELDKVVKSWGTLHA